MWQVPWLIGRFDTVNICSWCTLCRSANDITHVPSSILSFFLIQYPYGEGWIGQRMSDWERKFYRIFGSLNACELRSHPSFWPGWWILPVINFGSRISPNVGSILFSLIGLRFKDVLLPDRRIWCCDWLPDRVRWSDATRSGLPVLFPQENFAKV